MNKHLYPDLWVRIISTIVLTHFLIALDNSDGFILILLNPSYYIDLVIGFFVGFTGWSLAKEAIVVIENKIPWTSGKPFLRVISQLVFAIVLPSSWIAFLTYLQFTYIYDQTFEQTGYWTIEFPVTALFVVMVNLYYAAFHVYQLSRHKQQASPEGGKSILVHKGTSKIKVKANDIAHILLNTSYTSVTTFDDQKFVLSKTISEVEEVLSNEQFFRANRQSLVNIEACKEFKSIENGKMELTLTNLEDQKIIISQKRASSFRTWVSRN